MIRLVRVAGCRMLRWSPWAKVSACAAIGTKRTIRPRPGRLKLVFSSNGLAKEMAEKEAKPTKKRTSK